MPLDEDELFEDEEYDEDDRMPWEKNAEDAVDHALENADFDDVRGAITIQDLDYRWVECDNLEDLTFKLTELYEDAWYGSVPFDSGEAVFKGDPYGYVGDAIAHRDIEDFYIAISDPEDAEEIIASRELVPDSEKSRILRVDFQEINAELIQHLAKYPHYMRTMDPRKFEELIAELLRAKGYEVEVTRTTRDGGLDIIAIKRSDLGAALTLVECKRYAETNKVGVDIVRGLYGVVEAQRATRGLIATTSYFTKDAQAFRDQNQYRLSLADFDMLTKFLREWRGIVV